MPAFGEMPGFAEVPDFARVPAYFSRPMHPSRSYTAERRRQMEERLAQTREAAEARRAEAAKAIEARRSAYSSPRPHVGPEWTGLPRPTMISYSAPAEAATAKEPETERAAPVAETPAAETAEVAPAQN